MTSIQLIGLIIAILIPLIFIILVIHAATKGKPEYRPFKDVPREDLEWMALHSPSMTTRLLLNREILIREGELCQ